MFRAHSSRVSDVKDTQIFIRIIQGIETKAAWDTQRSLYLHFYQEIYLFSAKKKKILRELDSIIGKHVSWGIFREMKQSIISPKKAFQFLKSTQIAINVPRHRHKHKMRPRREPNAASQYTPSQDGMGVFVRASVSPLLPRLRVVCSFCFHVVSQGTVTQQKLSLNNYRPCWVRPTLPPTFLYDSKFFAKSLVHP